jgi:nucleolar protein 9
LTEQEQFLAGSQYGKYFARRVNLPLLKRRPDEWKNLQDRSLSGPKEPAVVSGQDILPQKKLVEATASREPRKRKREMKVTDEIDALFEESLGGKIKKAALGPVQGSGGLLGKKGDEKDDLDVVFSAIRAAPREERGKRKA